jgi:hypothetical protein
MAKRQKRVKRKGLYGKWSSSFINTGSTLNKIGMDALYSGNKLPLNSDGFLVTLFGKDTNSGGPSRVEALKLREKILHQIDPARHFKVLETEKLRVLMYYVNPESGFFFVQYEKQTGTVRKSLTYKSKERAMRYFRANAVKWISKFQAPPFTT